MILIYTICKNKAAAKKNYYSRIRDLIQQVYSYETPCIWQLTSDKVEGGYVEWLRQETKIV